MIILDDFNSITHFPEDVHNSLILISEWLCNNDKVGIIKYQKGCLLICGGPTKREEDF